VYYICFCNKITCKMKTPRYLRRAGTSILKNLATAGVKASDRLAGGAAPRYLRRAGTSIMKNLAHAGVRASDRLAGGAAPRYLRRAGTSIMKNLAHAGVRASDRLAGGKIKIPKALKKVGSKVGNALLQKGTEIAVGALLGAGPPRYLRKAGTSIMKNLAHAGVRASEKLTGGCYSGGSVARMYDPIAGKFLKTVSGKGFIPN
jgi:Arc/MetJ family transcription regulator